MENISRYILITCIAFLFSCGNKTKSDMVYGVVTSSEWYVYSLGFSTGGGKGYYKQNIKYSFVIDNNIYSGEFNNGPDIGALFEGDSIIIEVPNGIIESSKVIKRHKYSRDKYPSVSNISLDSNAFDSNYLELLKKSRIPEFEVTN